MSSSSTRMSFWHHLPRPIIGLAPMDGVTDIAFRHVIATYGRPDVLFTEFTNVHDICHGRVMGWEPLRYTDGQRPIVAQLYGKDPLLFYQAAHVVSELGFDGLDINMGCPSKNVASSGSGAGLIKTPELALDIMAATERGLHDWAEGQTLAEAGLKPGIVEKVRMVRAAQNHPAPCSALPLSVKTRLGYDSVIIKEWSACLAQGRPEVISIHGRTLQQMYRGDADWEAIAEAATQIRQRGILALGNGDIGSLNESIARIPGQRGGRHSHRPGGPGKPVDFSRQRIDPGGRESALPVSGLRTDGLAGRPVRHDPEARPYV